MALTVRWMKTLLAAIALAVLCACGGSEPSAPSPSNFTPDRSSSAALCASVCDGADSTNVSGSTCTCLCGAPVPPDGSRVKLVFDLGEDPAFWHEYWTGFRV